MNRFPRIGRLRPPAGLVLLPLLLAAAAVAQEAPPAVAREATADDQALPKVNGLFDTDLPKTERKGAIRLIINPHFGDFTSRSYLRLPVGVRWGVNDHVEVSGSIESFVEHGLRHGTAGNGLGDIQFGAKYAFRAWLKPDYDASVGLNTIVPVGHPPVDLTDGYNHYAPYVVISRKSPRTAGLTSFVSFTADYMDKSNVAGTFQKDVPHSNSLLLSTGFVLDRYPYHYTLETGWQTTALIGRDNRQFAFVKPGFAWDLPRRLTFNSRGRWLAGLSLKITQGPDGTRIDSGGKIRGEFSLRRWFGGAKKSPPPPAAAP